MQQAANDTCSYEQQRKEENASSSSSSFKQSKSQKEYSLALEELCSDLKPFASVCFGSMRNGYKFQIWKHSNDLDKLPTTADVVGEVKEILSKIASNQSAIFDKLVEPILLNRTARAALDDTFAMLKSNPDSSQETALKTIKKERLHLLVEDIGHRINFATFCAVLVDRLSNCLLNFRQHTQKSELVDELIWEFANGVFGILTIVNEICGNFVQYLLKGQQTLLLNAYKELVAVCAVSEGEYLLPKKPDDICEQFFIFSRSIFALDGGPSYVSADEVFSFAQTFLDLFANAFAKTLASGDQNTQKESIQAAIAYAQSCLKLATREPGIHDEARMGLHETLGILYGMCGRLSEAIPQLVQSVDVKRQVLGLNHIGTLASIARLAEYQILAALGKPHPTHAPLLEKTRCLPFPTTTTTTTLDPSGQMHLEMAKVYLTDALLRLPENQEQEEEESEWKTLAESIKTKLDFIARLSPQRTALAAQEEESISK